MRLSMTNLLMIMIHTYPLFLNTDAQIQYPEVSCPNIFQYSYDRNMGGYFGLVTVQRDGSSTSELQVNMSTNTQEPLTSNIKITVLSKQEEIFNGNEIKYIIQFPLQDVLPKLTLIQFNGKVLCRGDPDPLEPGIIQTSMWAKSIVTTFSGSDKNQPTTQKPANLYANSGFFFSIGAPGQRPFEYPNNPFIPETTTTIRNEIHPIQQPTTITTSTTTTTSVRPTTITTTKAPKTIDQCGVTKVSVLIIGGDGIAPGDFPWLAAIMYRQKSDYKFHCTGNLVSNKHVLTAGHCVRYHNAPLFENDDLIIVLGKLNIENWANGGTIRNAKRVISHPNYKQDTADYDIAIIVLSELVRFKPGIRPICLWERSDNLEDIVGTFGTVVGWGKQKESGDSSSLAQKIEMPVVSQENCLWSNKVFKKYTSSRTFCAGNRDKVTGPCAGDSGAGFMIKDEASKKWFLRGLVGFSIRDPQTLSCDLSSYVVFIDIAKVRDWIQEEMKADLDD